MNEPELINLFHPYVTEDMIDAVVKTLRSRFIGQGPKVDEFEKRFSEKFSQKYVATMNSGTSALETAYDLINLQPGDEVISTPLTCTATNVLLLRKGVKIVWADIRPDTLCISPMDVCNKMTERTKAIVQVHFGGIKADVGTFSIPIVSDAAQALGIFNGDFTCNSFQSIKHFSTIDGGMLSVNPDSRIANPERERNNAFLHRWFGIDRRKKIKNNWQAYKERKMTFDIVLPGTKRHMNDVSAAMGIVGLLHYEKILDHRKEIFRIYREELSGLDGLKLIDGPENKYWLAHLLVERRDDFAKMMHENYVDVNTVHVRNDVYKIFGGVNGRPNPKNPALPVMDELEQKYICIPLGMHVTEENAQYISDCIKRGW